MCLGPLNRRRPTSPRRRRKPTLEPLKAQNEVAEVVPEVVAAAAAMVAQEKAEEGPLGGQIFPALAALGVVETTDSQNVLSWLQSSNVQTAESRVMLPKHAEPLPGRRAKLGEKRRRAFEDHRMGLLPQLEEDLKLLMQKGKSRQAQSSIIPPLSPILAVTQIIRASEDLSWKSAQRGLEEFQWML